MTEQQLLLLIQKATGNISFLEVMTVVGAILLQEELSLPTSLALVMMMPQWKNGRMEHT